LGYVLGLAPLVQSDLSSSRVPSGTTPSLERGPAFLLPLAEVLGSLERLDADFAAFVTFAITAF